MPRALPGPGHFFCYKNQGLTPDFIQIQANRDIREALEDEDETVQSTAVWALGTSGDKRAVEPLIKKSHKLKNPPKRWVFL